MYAQRLHVDVLCGGMVPIDFTQTDQGTGNWSIIWHHQSHAEERWQNDSHVSTNNC